MSEEKTTDVPRPNLSGHPTETNIKFIRHFIEQQNVDVSKFDRIRLCQWIRQLLKYIDKLRAELSDETADAEAYFETIRRLKEQLKAYQETKLDEIDRWGDDGGQLL